LVTIRERDVSVSIRNVQVCSDPSAENLSNCHRVGALRNSWADNLSCNDSRVLKVSYLWSASGVDQIFHSSISQQTTKTLTRLPTTQSLRLVVGRPELRQKYVIHNGTITGFQPVS
jgi:hypothetical protein